MKYVVLEMDRLLRPQGYVIIREAKYFVESLEALAKGARWECKTHETEYKVENEQVLVCRKKMWYSSVSRA